ncbi:unnamed protein product [Cuscuta epithymum]|uniref:Uncharacterized protein n=1 Tax=Cuscuta epithymum TaxID=186058 RepID=A0AAV0D5I3_9ASTE|nr:unnamed protein product [Cuscuta epithymum]
MSPSFSAAKPPPPPSLTRYTVYNNLSLLPGRRWQFPAGNRASHNRKLIFSWKRPPPPPPLMPTSSVSCKYSNVVFPPPKRSLEIVNAHRPSINGTDSNRQTYSFRITVDIPFYEAPQASFDEYLEEKSRVLKAICPNEKRKPEQISEEEWRIYMAPVEFLFLSVSPVVNMRMRCKAKGMGYPSGIPPNTSKLLELKAMKSELKGNIDGLIKQTRFQLGVEGVVYPHRKGISGSSSSSIKGQLLMSITFTRPSALALVPQHLHDDAAQLILKSIGERMERNVSEGLLADYAKFKKEKL